MSKSEAIQAISRLSSGTVAHIIRSTKYERIDNAVNTWILTAANAAPETFDHCESWIDVLHAIKATA